MGENGADFVLQRASVQNPGHTNRLEGYIVLGDVQILEHLFNSTVVATDGTFSIAPPPFSQLTTFVFFFTNIHNIRKAFCGIHVLFTHKTSFIYNHFLNWLVVRYGINNIHWENIMMDNEQAMIASLHDNIPQVNVRSCFFHFGQAIQRWICHNGLQIFYNEDDSTLKIYVGFVKALGLLPVNEVLDGYNLIIGSINIKIC